MKTGEALAHAAVWLAVENTMLSARSPSQKATYCVIPLIRNVQSRQLRRDSKQMVSLGGQSGAGGGE